MARYLLNHRHQPDGCGVLFTSFKGHQSPLSHWPTLASCRNGGHAIWWAVQAGSKHNALRRLRGRRSSRREQRKAPDPMGCWRPASCCKKLGPHRRLVLVRAIRREDEPVAVVLDVSQQLATACSRRSFQPTRALRGATHLSPQQRGGERNDASNDINGEDRREGRAPR